MAQFNLPSFEMLPPTETAANRRQFQSSTSSKLFRQLDPLVLLADQSQSFDAAELPLSAQPQHQEQAHQHVLFVKAAANATLHAGTSNSNTEPPAARPSKKRIRWTQDLHEHFVECVNELGGADEATPKRILKLLNSDGLTIYHIKSHLQKYRTAKCTPPPSPSPEGKQHEKWGDTQNLELRTGMQYIMEALRVQLDVQRRLDQQLEMQRRLQVRIEEQGKMLQKMFEVQLKASGGSNTPLPSPGPDNVLFRVVATAKQDDAVFADFVVNDGDEMQLMSLGSG